MGNISVKINLKQLKHVERNFKGAGGNLIKCLVIPIHENNLHEGEKGTYIDLQAIEVKNKVGDSKDTHLVKQQLKKEVYEKMTQEEQRAMPILGNAILWSRREPDPVAATSIAPGSIGDEDEDDLPF